MTFAIKWGSFDSDDNAAFIYFDAITASSANYRGQVTKHPVDSGGVITDHFIKENPVFQFTGIITGTDLSSSSSLIKAEDGSSAYNSKEEPLSISISNTGSKLLQFVPASVGQFLNKQEPEIEVDAQTRTDLQYEIACRDIIVNLIQGISYNKETQQLENKINLVDLYEFDDTNIRRITNNLVLTNFSTNETPESGDALLVDITLEQVEFATLKREALPANVKKELQAKNSKTDNKGKQDSTSEEVGQEGDDKSPGSTDPQKQVYFEEASQNKFNVLNPNADGYFKYTGGG